MLDRWYKIATIVAALVIIVSAVVGPSVGAIFWLARLDIDVAGLQKDVTDLQRDVADLQKDVAELQQNVAELQRGQAVMLDILQRLADDIPELRSELRNHTHDANGRVQLPLDR